MSQSKQEWSLTLDYHLQSQSEQKWSLRLDHHLKTIKLLLNSTKIKDSQHHEPQVGIVHSNLLC